MYGMYVWCRLALGLAGGTEQRQTVRPATADRVM